MRPLGSEAADEVEWAPDGERLLVAGGGAISVVDADGDGREAVVSGAGAVQDAAWSPDGGSIVLVRQFGAGGHDHADVRTVPARGGRERVRFSRDNFIGRIDWQPLPRR